MSDKNVEVQEQANVNVEKQMEEMKKRQEQQRIQQLLAELQMTKFVKENLDKSKTPNIEMDGIRIPIKMVGVIEYLEKKEKALEEILKPVLEQMKNDKE